LRRIRCAMPMPSRWPAKASRSSSSNASSARQPRDHQHLPRRHRQFRDHQRRPPPASTRAPTQRRPAIARRRPAPPGRARRGRARWASRFPGAWKATQSAGWVGALIVRRGCRHGSSRAKPGRLAPGD
jgi:hypothetical protein